MLILISFLEFVFFNPCLPELLAEPHIKASIECDNFNVLH